MLSERQLAAILEVFEERTQKVVNGYLQRMGEHLRDIGKLTDTDIHRLTQLKRMNANVETTKRAIADASNQNIQDIYEIFRAIAEDNVRFAKAYFQTDHMPPIKAKLPQGLSAPLERVLKAQLRQTAQAMSNLSQTTIQVEKYTSAIDVAIQTVQTGLTDYNSAIRSALRKAAEDGPRVEYPSGLTRRLDTAVRQNVLDGVRQLNQDTMRQLGKDYGADGVEISAHGLCANDHLPYQGLQMSLKEFDKLQIQLDRPIGQWNCKHTVFYIILGVSPPTYAPEELEQMRVASMEQVTIGSTTMSRYEWTQRQRQIETAVRYQKDIAVAAASSGDMVLRREVQANINKLDAEYSKISNAAGLYLQRDRMGVSGFRRVKTIAELPDAKKYAAANFASEKLQKKHILKHLSEYGDITEDEYLHRARKLLQANASDDILILTRPNGDIEKYSVSKNEFAVGAKDGYLRTAFKPKRGILYWRNEFDKYGEN